MLSKNDKVSLEEGFPLSRIMNGSIYGINDNKSEVLEYLWSLKEMRNLLFFSDNKLHRELKNKDVMRKISVF